MSSSGPFKFCSSCRGKIPFSDGHDLCLFCLGEAHQPDSYTHCKKFTKLSPAMDSSTTALPSPGVPDSTPPISGTKSKLKTKPIKAKTRHKTNKAKKKTTTLASMPKIRNSLSAPSLTTVKVDDQTLWYWIPPWRRRTSLSNQHFSRSLAAPWTGETPRLR